VHPAVTPAASTQAENLATARRRDRAGNGHRTGSPDKRGMAARSRAIRHALRDPAGGGWVYDEQRLVVAMATGSCSCGRPCGSRPKRGPLEEVGLPSTASSAEWTELIMVAVVLGVDPAKRSNAVSVIDGRERELVCLQVVNDSNGYWQLLALGRQ